MKNKSKKGKGREKRIDSKQFLQIWNFINFIAFPPKNSDSDIKGWLNCCGDFFTKLFELEPSFNKKDRCRKKSTSFCGTIKAQKLGDAFLKYRIERDLSEFHIEIQWQNNCYLFEYDSRYICEFDYLEKHGNEHETAFERNELEKVLRNKIDHPAIHLHIKKNNFPHDIRIGTATKNPFLFLYQVSYQFLALMGEDTGKTKKDDELKRLTDVIDENKNNKDQIGPGTLFGLGGKQKSI